MSHIKTSRDFIKSARHGKVNSGSIFISLFTRLAGCYGFSGRALLSYTNSLHFASGMDNGTTNKWAKVGNTSTHTVFVLGVAYAVVIALGLLSLPTPLDPIGDPYFTLMEMLTLLIAPAMAISMVSIHFMAAEEDRVYSFAGAVFMFIMAAITSCVHFVILVFSHQVSKQQLTELAPFLSFRWPSVFYALDVLAWDWFYPLAFIFAAQAFRNGRLERRIRVLMIVSAVLSLGGLMGVVLANMQVRNIGIVGYAVVGPVCFLMVGRLIRGKTF